MGAATTNLRRAKLEAALASLDAVEEAAATLRDALVPLPAQDPVRVLRLARAESVWRQLAHDGGLLTAAQVGRLLGSRASSERAAADFANAKYRQGLLLAARRAGSNVYPAYQFDENGVRDFVPVLRRAATALGVSDEALVRWMVRPTTFWDVEGSLPLDHASDVEGLIAALHYTQGAGE